MPAGCLPHSGGANHGRSSRNAGNDRPLWQSLTADLDDCGLFIGRETDSRTVAEHRVAGRRCSHHGSRFAGGTVVSSCVADQLDQIDNLFLTDFHPPFSSSILTNQLFLISLGQTTPREVNLLETALRMAMSRSVIKGVIGQLK